MGNLLFLVDLANTSESLTNSFYTRMRAVNESSDPPDPAALKKLIDEDNKIRTNPTPIQNVASVDGKNQQHRQCILMASMIKELIDANEFPKCVTSMITNKDKFWVFLYKKAQSKYQTYVTNNGILFSELLYTITKDKTVLLTQLQKDFFPDCEEEGSIFIKFKSDYLTYVQNKKPIVGGKRKKMGNRTRRRRK
jgi:hypothetical protein